VTNEDQEIELRPIDIKFTQADISSRFTEGYPVEARVNEIKQDPERINNVPQIRIMRIEGAYWSLDNRRLYILQKCVPNKLIKCTLVPHNQQNMEEFRVKKTSKDGGMPRFRNSPKLSV